MKKVFLILLAVLPFVSTAQNTNVIELYKRADEYQKRYSSKFYGGDLHGSWMKGTHYFFYSITTPNGTEYFVLDAAKKKQTAAFDQKKLAAALSKATGKEVEPYDLPIRGVKLSSSADAMTFRVDEEEYSYNIKKNTLTSLGKWEYPDEYGDRWDFPMENNPKAVLSPDGTKEAFIRDYDLYVRDKASGDEMRMTSDGTAQGYYSSKIAWSPDSKKLVSSYFVPVKERQITIVESCPAKQLEPLYDTFDYVKPGDTLQAVRPVLFDLASRFSFPVEMEDPARQFYQDWTDNDIRWQDDSRSFTFTYNKRGHDRFIVYKVDAETGESMPLIDERSETFIDYRRNYIHFLEKSGEVLWLSDRDGWRHLYIYDYDTGGVKRQVTSGEWVVRSVEYVDEAARKVIIRGLGRDTGEDPYFAKYYSVNLDSGEVFPLTPENSYHIVWFSDDMRFMVDSWSRVDMPPVTVLRDAQSGKVLTEVVRADISAMLADGYRMPEPFVAKGRDGVTDIYGIIMRPTDFDPQKKYPVIEYIYAGPHNSFVPKTFDVQEKAALAEMGFIVVQIDGMGTNNRSKAFHNVAWKNLKDSGFPDRILWIEAAAEKYPEMDISNMAIFGYSAGGQSTMSALLFFGDFYKVGVASCGCYDNRMDKIWWNEQWMGEVGPHYDDSSSRVHAANLKGKLMLILGAMDDNVDPSSTLQVAEELIRAGKEFDYVVLPTAGHTEGEDYGERKRRDFFVRHLLKLDPPDWNN